LARETFINWLDREGKKLGVRLERGVSGAVKAAAEKIVQDRGPEGLRQVAKAHFRPAQAVAP